VKQQISNFFIRLQTTLVLKMKLPFYSSAKLILHLPATQKGAFNK